MTAIYIQNAIKSKNESPRLDDFNITTGEEYANDISCIYTPLSSVPSRDNLYIIGDWNAKVGKYISNGIIGNFGLGRETSEVINL